MLRSILSILIVLFGLWVGLMLPGVTVAFVLLCALAGMCTGLAFDRARTARPDAGES